MCIKSIFKIIRLCVDVVSGVNIEVTIAGLKNFILFRKLPNGINIIWGNHCILGTHKMRLNTVS